MFHPAHRNPYYPNPSWGTVALVAAVVVAGAVVDGVTVAALRGKSSFRRLSPTGYQDEPIMCFVHAGHDVCVWKRVSTIGMLPPFNEFRFAYTIDDGISSEDYRTADEARAAAIGLLGG